MKFITRCNAGSNEPVSYCWTKCDCWSRIVLPSGELKNWSGSWSRIVTDGTIDQWSESWADNWSWSWGHF